MTYYIDVVNTWKPANRKCLEVLSLAQEYRQTLIPDEAAAEGLVKEIREKVEELNVLYPRTKRLMVKKEGNFVACINEDRKLDDQYVFTFHIKEVRRVYKTLEMMVDEKEKGGEG